MSLKLRSKVLIAVSAAVAVAVIAITGGGFIQAGKVPSANASVSAPDWAKNAVIYEVNTRQYTPEGTFDAMATHLPRLKALGVDVLWFMPINPISVAERKGTLGSPYSIADYKAVNPELGTAQDFKDLVNAAHALGMKVVLDWVANHTGWDNPWITQHPDWYTQVNGKIIWPAGTDWTDVADLNYDNQQMRAAMIDALKYWVTDFDIDGYRADVAGGVPTDFWNTATAQVNAIKPLFWLAENGDNSDLLQSAFQANYNWDLLGTLNKNATGLASKYSFTDSLLRTESWFPAGSYPMNFITNHDENSWNATEYTRLGSFVNSFAALTFTVPGMPLIYTGQEVGNRKMLQFFERDTISWDGDPATTAFYTKLVKLKHQMPALEAGPTGAEINFLSSSSGKMLVFTRIKGSSKVIVMINTSLKSQKTTVKFGGKAGKYYDFKTGMRVSLAKSQALTIPAAGFKIFTDRAIK